MTPSDLFRERWRARDNRVLISVHRGLWGPLPENSRAAIEAGHSFGIVEIDVQLSKDGIPVLMHDPDLQRMAGNTGKVAMLSAAELSAHHLREGDGGPDARITQETLPALADVLADVPDRAFFDFDVKEDREVEAVAAAIQNLGHAHTGSIKIDVNTPEDAKRRAALEERYGIMVMAKVMLPDAAPNVIETLVQSGAASAEIYFDDFDQLGKAAKAAGES
ncbi:glycerophosphodiester phosphodiesterase family protein [Ovoidimarina sediminis]|uniref:glycerophosphodiester phosphodiesterase family protein n=1 Tax=Ovoidimarina sediminis TaxID=3079856 RepID=UPI00290C6063|nr:glycerophosphodiester phosphodiesterase family protein [Rhodophyticola sp. MJ-SS7]MDU8945253.1 glycerophosphodiester phosphodiesterase family protein [Rhodophyticola sp. MJ-SS7]